VASANEPYSLSEMAYQCIVSAVIDGRFPVDSKLPSEIELSRQLGISRPVLRAALIRLRQDGLLTSRQGSGNFVLRQPHPTVLLFAPLSRLSDVQDCFKFRIAIEGEAAFYAALNPDPAPRVEFEKFYAELEAATEMGEAAVDADVSLHLKIAMASKNSYLTVALEAVREKIAFGISITRRLSLRRSRTRLSLVQKEHRAVLDCILCGNAEGARTEMRAHLENARRRLFEGDLQERVGSPGLRGLRSVNATLLESS
jgi:GntR family transcriptional regulator, transcriptional repressor for pyruvate dehydrogenase complex